MGEPRSCEELQGAALVEEASKEKLLGVGLERPIWRSPSRVALLSSIFLFVVVAGLCGNALPGLSGVSSAAAKARRLGGDPCAEFPLIQFNKVLWSNLGGYGPDFDQPPSIVYEVTMKNLGQVKNENGEKASSQTLAHLHVNTFSPYVPNWAPSNGLDGQWAKVNWKPGTSVGLVANFKDPVDKKNLTLPKGFMSFADIDAGKESEREFVTLMNFFANYYIADQGENTMVQTDEHILTTTFWGKHEDLGRDNPDSHKVLTQAQKRKMVTVQFGSEGLQAAIFKFGSLKGKSAREIRFGFAPALLCSQTKLEDGTLKGAFDGITIKTNGREVTKESDVNHQKHPA